MDRGLHHGSISLSRIPLRATLSFLPLFSLSILPRTPFTPTCSFRSSTYPPIHLTDFLLPLSDHHLTSLSLSVSLSFFLPSFLPSFLPFLLHIPPCPSLFSSLSPRRGATISFQSLHYRWLSRYCPCVYTHATKRGSRGTECACPMTNEWHLRRSITGRLVIARGECSRYRISAQDAQVCHVEIRFTRKASIRVKVIRCEKIRRESVSMKGSVSILYLERISKKLGYVRIKNYCVTVDHFCK